MMNKSDVSSKISVHILGKMLHAIYTTYLTLSVLGKKYSLLWATRARMLELCNKYEGRTVFCVGNGPSLTVDQIQLASGFPFIATNRAHQLFTAESFEDDGNGWIIMNDNNRCFEVLPDLPTSYSNVVFSTFLPNSLHDIVKLSRKYWIFAPCKWKVFFNRHGLQLAPDLQQIFSENFSKVYYPGYSVIFSAIQLAYYMGASRIVLIGCDMNYSGATQYSDLIKLERLNIGHLGSFNYDTQGKDHMIACRDALSSYGKELLNGTIGGAIHELRRISYQQLLELSSQERQSVS